MFELGFQIPLWAILLIGIIAIIIAWKIIKFAIMVLFILIAALVLLIIMDAAGVFQYLKNIIGNFLIFNLSYPLY